MTADKRLNGAQNGLPARIGAGPGEYDRTRLARQRLKQRVNLPFFAAGIERLRMECHQQRRGIQPQAQRPLQGGGGHGRDVPQVVQPRSAGHGHPPGFLAHPDDPAGVLPGGDKMQVAHLGDGVPEQLIHGALGDFTAMQVGHGDMERRRRRRDRQHLIAVAQHDQHVRRPALEIGRRVAQPPPHGVDHAARGVPHRHNVNSRINGKPIRQQPANRTPVPRREMRSGDHHPKPHARRDAQAPEQRTVNGVIRAPAGDDADGSHDILTASRLFSSGAESARANSASRCSHPCRSATNARACSRKGSNSRGSARKARIFPAISSGVA